MSLPGNVCHGWGRAGPSPTPPSPGRCMPLPRGDSAEVHGLLSSGGGCWFTVTKWVQHTVGACVISVPNRDTHQSHAICFSALWEGARLRGSPRLGGEGARRILAGIQCQLQGREHLSSYGRGRGPGGVISPGVGGSEHHHAVFRVGAHRLDVSGVTGVSQCWGVAENVYECADKAGVK